MTATSNGKASTSTSQEIVLKAKRRPFSPSENAVVCGLSKQQRPECEVQYYAEKGVFITDRYT